MFQVFFELQWIGGDETVWFIVVKTINNIYRTDKTKILYPNQKGGDE